MPASASNKVTAHLALLHPSLHLPYVEAPESTLGTPQESHQRGTCNCVAYPADSISSRRRRNTCAAADMTPATCRVSAYGRMSSQSMRSKKQPTSHSAARASVASPRAATCPGPFRSRRSRAGSRPAARALAASVMVRSKVRAADSMCGNLNGLDWKD